MLNNRNLVVDTFCELHYLLKHIADVEVSNFDNHEIIPNSIYVISYYGFQNKIEYFKNLVKQDIIKIILCHPMEGSETLVYHCEQIEDLLQQNKIWLISGGEMESKWPYLLFDNFMSKILDYKDNLVEIKRTNEIFSKTVKPYKFLFLNGRMRHHRKYLLEKFKYDGILDQSLWTNLDPVPHRFYPFVLPQELNLDNNTPSAFIVQQLPEKYEVQRYKEQIYKTLENPQRDLALKYHLFNDEWGDIYLNAEPYIDTYFSVVTETVFEYPYSFRTEKTWKPIAMGHPVIFASNYGYYRDFKNLGFKTFGHLIDESFDNIENVQDRIVRISEIVKDLCNQDLPAFLAATEETCKYNQQHLAEMCVKVRKEFPQRFINFINERSRI